MKASLCILAYKRPEKLRSCLESILKTVDFPCEIIVNLDSDSTPENRQYLFEMLNQNKISKLIMVNGKNRGVGRSFQNCLGVAEGDYIFKIDTDLIFKPQWLSTAIKILDNNNDIGAVSLFNYRHYDPNDTRFEILHYREDCLIVNDFVSSVYGFRNPTSDPHFGKDIPDDGLHKSFGDLAITTTDFVENSGFGVTKSTYVSGTEDHPYKTPTFNEPLIFS
jgi:glycosyltransferase involved in cell wall biosynthesis